MIIDTVENGANLVATATVYFDDCFAVHDIKVLRDPTGVLYVKMPSRPMVIRCDACHGRAYITNRFCGRCGVKLGPSEPKYFDIAHPINNEFRTQICEAILGEMTCA